jgi:hypothetical protein
MAGTRAWWLRSADSATLSQQVPAAALAALVARHRLLFQVAVFVLTALAAVEMGSLIAATGGLPNPYASTTPCWCAPPSPCPCRRRCPWPCGRG